MYQAGEPVEVNMGGKTGELWRRGTIREIRTDGKLRVELEPTNDKEKQLDPKVVVRAAAFVRRPPAP